MVNTTQSSATVIDFEALSRGRDSSMADGHIGVYEGENRHLVAVVTLSPKVLADNLNKLHRALRDNGFTGRNSYFGIQHEHRPGTPFFIVFSTFEFAMETELGLLIDYLHQSGVLKNPIVCDLRWIKMKSSKK